KTTIAKHIAERIDVAHVLCDDFFVGGRNPFWATQSAQYQIDNVIDWRRIRREVIEPLKAVFSRVDLSAKICFENVETKVCPHVIVAEPGKCFRLRNKPNATIKTFTMKYDLVVHVNKELLTKSMLQTQKQVTPCQPDAK